MTKVEKDAKVAMKELLYEVVDTVLTEAHKIKDPSVYFNYVRTELIKHINLNILDVTVEDHTDGGLH